MVTCTSVSVLFQLWPKITILFVGLNDDKCNFEFYGKN